MPGTRQRDTAQNLESPEGNSELEKPTDSDEQVDFDGDNDQEETMEEVEYEEVEEEEEEKLRKRSMLSFLHFHLMGLRIMKGKETSEAKGYAFVTFKTKELAYKAIKELNNSEFKDAPSENEVALRRTSCNPNDGFSVQGNTLMSSGQNEPERPQCKNRVLWTHCPTQNGCRVESIGGKETKHMACPRMAVDDRPQEEEANMTESEQGERQINMTGREQCFHESENVDLEVKLVYVKNLPENITQDRLKELSEHHGKITKVVLPSAKTGQEKSRFGFVHFAERSSAMKALKNAEKYEIDGQTLECSLAKPQANSHKPAVLPAYPPHLGYGGMIGSAIGAGFGTAGFAQVALRLMDLCCPHPVEKQVNMIFNLWIKGNSQGFNSLLQCQYPDMGGVVAVAQVVGNAVMIITAIVDMAAIIPTNLGFKELGNGGLFLLVSGLPPPMLNKALSLNR
ncbi:Polyadenylate-binding protein, cytoplasmic and nuclear [Glycine soja]|nr:Polyadenylate-binding protein, cytoplasmic and nuclear [Glycine soja]